MSGAQIGTLITAVAALLGAVTAWIRADVATRTANRTAAQVRRTTPPARPPAAPAAPAAPASPAPAGTTPASSEEVK